MKKQTRKNLINGMLAVSAVMNLGAFLIITSKEKKIKNKIDDLKEQMNIIEEDEK